MNRARSWRWARWAIGPALVALVVGAYLAWDESRAAGELATAAREMADGRYLVAKKRLVELTGRLLARDDAWLARGDCELALGETDQAMASWSKVRDGSTSAGPAEVRVARVLFGRGKLAPAEQELTAALARAGPHQDEARDRLILLLKFQGRLAEVRRLIQAGWQADASPVAVVRQLWDHDYTIYPIDGVRRFLEDAARTSPDDDRVWLARANLLTRLGKLDEAGKLLDDCLARRPDDPALWRSRLDWAVAADRVEDARQAFAHLSTGHLDPVDWQALRAWFARRRGDAQAERSALEAVVALELREASPLERLAELATLQGDLGAASALRARKIDHEKAIEAYKAILFVDDPAARASELARVAEALGRPFDARCWWTLESRKSAADPEHWRALARLDALAKAAASDRSLDTLKAEVFPPKEATSVALDANPAATLAIPRFVDDAEASGLVFTYDNGRSEARQLPETMGGGVALLDFDGDGRLDVYAVQGGPFPPEITPFANQDRLFKNLGDGKFRDVTEASGLARLPGGYGHGVAVGDFDNDGDPDLFVTRWRSYALFRNKGDGTFEDATEAVGLSGDRDWPTSAAFADLDNDGDLDLYVCHYLDWDPSNPNPCPQDDPKSRYYCYPRLFRALPDHLFRNDGGRFVDATADAGVVDKEGRGLGVVAGDLDADGLVDLFVANDTTANYYFHNLGGLRFEEIAATSGVAANGSGTLQAGMGVAFGDQDGDGLMDLAVTNFYAEGTSLFSCAGAGKNLFFDHSVTVGLASTSRNLLGFGVAFLDANNDGRLDLLAANGHVNDGRPRLPYAMPAHLWLGDSRGRLVDATDRSGDPFQVSRLGRGLVVGDLDDDGRVDALILSEGEPLAYFHNATPTTPQGHSATFRLEGRASNRDAVGARVKLMAGGRAQVAQRFGGGSYQSASDPRLHFGLGAADRVDSIEVTWPSGLVSRHANLPADRGYLIREGDPDLKPLPHSPR